MQHIQVTDKIRLEAVNMSMAQMIFDTICRDRKYLRKWLPFVEMTHSISDTEFFLESVINQPGSGRDEVYAIWYMNEFAGLIGFKDTDRVNLKSEIGYWLAEKMQGKGIVTLCTGKLIEYAFGKLKLNRIQLKVAIGNSKSSAVARRLGFQAEGVERQGERHGSRFLDLEVFSVLRTEWNRP